MIIITGGAGFIGSQLLKALNENGQEEILIVDNLGSSSKWENLVGLSFYDYIHKDSFISNLSTLPKIKFIFHLGACSDTQESNINYLFDNNFKFSKKLCSYALKKKIPFVYASSAATYGNGSLGYSDKLSSMQLKPLNGYAYSKYLFDVWLEKMNLLNQVTGLKFFNVYGNGEFHKEEMRSVILKSFLQIKNEKKIQLFKSYHSDYKDGEQARDFIYIKDVIRILMYFYENPTLSGIFNVGTGQARTFLDLTHAVFKAMKLAANIEFIPMPNKIRNKYQYYTKAELEKLFENNYKQKFYSLEEGVMDYVQNYLIPKYG